MHIVSDPNFTLAIARGFSRLDSIFISLWNSGQAGSDEINTFYHPNGNGPLTRAGDSVRLSIQIGGSRWPVYEVSSVAEFFHRLQQVVGVHVGESALSMGSRA